MLTESVVNASENTLVKLPKVQGRVESNARSFQCSLCNLEDFPVLAVLGKLAHVFILEDNERKDGSRRTTRDNHHLLKSQFVEIYLTSAYRNKHRHA